MVAKSVLTIKDAQPVLASLSKAGLRPRLVGSVARTGRSEHDIDIVLPFEADKEAEDLMDYPQYRAYVETMEGLGFQNVGEGTLEKEGVEGEGSEVESWRRGDLIVDVFPTAVETPRPARRHPAKRTRKQRRRSGVATDVCLGGVR